MTTSSENPAPPAPTGDPARDGRPTKYIFVTGGVVSSIGKGITSAALGRLLRNRGFKVAMQKLDPYINVDAGTIYSIPVTFEEEGFADHVVRRLGLPATSPDLDERVVDAFPGVEAVGLRETPFE